MSAPTENRRCLANCTKTLSDVGRLGERLKSVCKCCSKVAQFSGTSTAEEQPPAEIEVILTEDTVQIGESSAAAPNKTPVWLLWIPKNWRKFLGPFKPLFGGYTIEDAGASSLIPPWPLFAFRIIWTLALIALLGWASAFKEPVPIALLAIHIIGSSLIAASSGLAARKVKFDILAVIAVPIYQTLASISLFTLPLLVWVATVSDVFPTATTNRLALYVVTAVIPAAMFLIDALVLGAKAKFRVQIAWIPVLVEYLAVFIPDIILTASGMYGRGLVGVFFYTVFWSVGSALVAVIATRAHNCKPFCSLEDGEQCDQMSEDEEMSVAELAATHEVQQV